MALLVIAVSLLRRIFYCDLGRIGFVVGFRILKLA